jgi:hypothetical protein
MILLWIGEVVGLDEGRRGGEWRFFMVEEHALFILVEQDCKESPHVDSGIYMKRWWTTMIKSWTGSIAKGKWQNGKMAEWPRCWELHPTNVSCVYLQEQLGNYKRQIVVGNCLCTCLLHALIGMKEQILNKKGNWCPAGIPLRSRQVVSISILWCSFLPHTFALTLNF